MLQYFADRGIPVLGVEPAANVAAVAREKGIPTLVKFFGVETATQLRDDGLQADLQACLFGGTVRRHRGGQRRIKPRAVHRHHVVIPPHRIAERARCIEPVAEDAELGHRRHGLSIDLQQNIAGHQRIGPGNRPVDLGDCHRVHRHAPHAEKRGEDEE